MRRMVRNVTNFFINFNKYQVYVKYPNKCIKNIFVVKNIMYCIAYKYYLFIKKSYILIVTLHLNPFWIPHIGLKIEDGGHNMGMS